MFGYVRTDTPYLYIKDKTLYEAMYCGVCKGISAVCGQKARFALSYDVTFLSVILHNILGEDVRVEKSHCLTHCIRSKMMAGVDELTKRLGALNVILAYYKCLDDVADEGKGKGKRFLFKKGYKRAKKAYPALEKIVRDNLVKQAEIEKARVDSIDRAADATAKMLAQVCDYLLGDKANEYTYNLFYCVGKWIYLIDALDDYDKDVKKGAYNPFALCYGAPCKAALLEGKNGDEVRFAFHAIFYDVRENLEKIPFCFNRDLSDNILLRGLPKTTKNVLDGCSHNKDKKAETKDTTI
ncbi:MAG: hypothetical protein E7355_04390 [Clostridiales bacterium]|nr:hypothetical protein [Clostridiales bacterium]